MGHSAGAGGGGGKARYAVAAVFAIGAVAVAVWQWQSHSRPRPGSRESREARQPAGLDRGQMARHTAEVGGGSPAGEAAPGAPVGGGDGGGRRVEARSLEDAARQLGTTPERLRERMNWERPDTDADPGAAFAFQSGATEPQAADVRRLLAANIEKAAPPLLTWTTAPTKEAGELAEAASAAIVGRIRGDGSFREMVTGLGGDVSVLPPEGSEPRGALALGQSLAGAGIDPARVRLRAAPTGDDAGLPMPAGAPPGALMVSKTRAGDGPELTQVMMPAGSLFPEAAAAKGVRAIEVRVPLMLASVKNTPGLASLAVTMVRVREGVWQPGAFALYLYEESVEKAILPRRGR